MMPKPIPASDLPAPINLTSNRSQVALRDWVATLFHRFQKQDIFLNLRSKMKQVHDLGHAWLRDLSEISEFRLSSNYAVF